MTRVRGSADSEAPPLGGVHVTCLAVYVPALAASQRLRESGASVTVIEPPGGDPLQAVSPAWYGALHEECATRRLDLKDPGGAAAFAELLDASDVLITAIRPAALDRLGLGWAALHARHPALCHVAITGLRAPAADAPGHDLLYQARLGLVDPPHLPRTLLADLAGGERAAFEAVALLLARARDGRGGRRDVSLADAAEPFAAPLRFGLTGVGAPLGGALACYGLYEARDGWVAVAALEPHFWRRLCAAFGAEGHLDRDALTRVFGTQDVAYWERWALERDLPIAGVRAAVRDGAPPAAVAARGA